uniref:Rho-GAP domain-containing protein n=1 Tax=Percolomonas cosmopolitus TaxID=63605 RepID=A0A7S1PEB4_9EUKA|mmetsp:Transcript_11358/g.42625  ORF Transcript_11358/g.42625 Transcript_11358/m.42625 type:complete len:344 (+) Transcript_11358:29-1060(+)|eukprot:CAMPEP_0117439642 /NCGR_PEP_ID=MMETSP0759-20121206/2669_1 /TAXON_ID=63605 /ORGANISM="Percolomonas cosmopolitus, Strain WS" /LENGTH=343 /DNA_ID=CAMNT_0005231361 /DNA_START=29 /DNA_END=1060 /DNA_ORIENTATION=+
MTPPPPSLTKLESLVAHLQSIHKAAVTIGSKNSQKQHILLAEVRPLLLQALSDFPQEFPTCENVFSMKIDEEMLRSSTLNSILGYLDRDLVVKQEGIFRLSGSKKIQNEWKERIQRKTPSRLNQESDVHAIAGLFKEWLRDMPDALIGGDQKEYDNWIDVGKRIVDPSQRMQCINTLLMRIQPLARRQLLLRILRLMKKVVSFSDTNQMGSKNLGIVFGINAIRPDGKHAKLQDATAAAVIWQCLVDDLDAYTQVLQSSNVSREVFVLPKPKLPSWSRIPSSGSLSEEPPSPNSTRRPAVPEKRPMPMRSMSIMKASPPVPAKRSSSGKIPPPALPKKVEREL